MKRVALIGAAALAACVTHTKPRPIPPIVDEMIQASGSVVRAAALQAASDQGIPIQSVDTDRGEIDTKYFDIGQFIQAASDYPQTERLVRIRMVIRVDPRGSGTRLIIQGIYAPFQNEFGMSHRNERSIPKHHPAVSLIKALAARAKKLAEGG